VNYPSASAPRILIAEDDRDLAQLLCSLLPAEARVVVEHDGIAAVNSVRNALRDGAHFDLLCLDLNLPGMDGARVLRAVRRLEAEFARPGLEPMRIVMMTTSRERATVRAALAAGVNDYLVKPFSPEEFLQRLQLERLSEPR